VKKKERLNAAVCLEQVQDLVAKSSPELVAMLPQRLEEIFNQELYKEWSSAAGKPFESFVEALEAPQPWGIGIGQHSQQVSPFLVYHLCDGYSDLQKALRPFVLERVPAMASKGGDRRSKNRNQSDNITLKDRGTGEEYLLRRLKKHDAEHGTEFAAKWARGEYASVRKAAIAAGIVKPKTGGRPLKKDEDPVAMVKRYWLRSTSGQRKTIRSWLRSKEAKALNGR
jgi:hypothetical protein